MVEGLGGEGLEGSEREEVVDGLDVEAFFDFGVRGDKEVEDD